MAQVTRGEIRLAASPQPTRSRALFAPRSSASPEEQARAVSQGYVAERLAETHQHEAPGVRGYFWGLRRRMEENWRPPAVREPSLAETALATVAMPADMLLQVQRSAQGDAVTPGRRGAAIDALEGANLARGNNPANLTMAPFQGIVDASAGNTRRTRAEVEVLQDEDGAVTSVRVLRSSGREAFDRAAEHAVREALPLGDAVAMPGRATLAVVVRGGGVARPVSARCRHELRREQRLGRAALAGTAARPTSRVAGERAPRPGRRAPGLTRATTAPQARRSALGVEVQRNAVLRAAHHSLQVEPQRVTLQAVQKFLRVFHARGPAPHHAAAGADAESQGDGPLEPGTLRAGGLIAGQEGLPAALQSALEGVCRDGHVGRLSGRSGVGGGALRTGRRAVARRTGLGERGRGDEQGRDKQQVE